MPRWMHSPFAVVGVTAGRSLKELLNQNSLKRVGQKCWGRQPWQRRTEEASCDQMLRVLQREPDRRALRRHCVGTGLDDSGARRNVTVRRHHASKDQCSGRDYTGRRGAFRGPALPNLHQAISGRTVSKADVQNWLERHFLLPVKDAASTDAFSQQQVLLEEWPTLTTPTGRATTRAPLIVRRDEDSESSFFELESMISNVYLVERLREVRAFRAFRRVRLTPRARTSGSRDGATPDLVCPPRKSSAREFFLSSRPQQSQPGR